MPCKRNNVIALLLGSLLLLSNGTVAESLKDSPLVNLYQNKNAPEKGPVRIRFLIEDELAVKVDWDHDFQKRHLILREVKKGFTGYMYQFESDLMSPASQCEDRNQRAHVNVVLKVSDISTGYSNDDFLNFYQLKLESYINYTIAKLDTSKTEFGYIQFSESGKGSLKLSRSAVKKLRKYGDRLARSFIEAKLNELIAHLHKGVEGSAEQVGEKMAVCQQAMNDALALVHGKTAGTS